MKIFKVRDETKSLHELLSEKFTTIKDVEKIEMRSMGKSPLFFYSQMPLFHSCDKITLVSKFRIQKPNPQPQNMLSGIYTIF